MQAYPGFLGRPRESNLRVYLGTRPCRGEGVLLFAGLSKEYGRYEFEFEDVRSSVDGATLSLQMGLGAVVASGYQYHVTELICNAATYASGNSASAAQLVVANNIGNAAGENYTGIVQVSIPENAGSFPMVTALGGSLDSAGLSKSCFCFGNYNVLGMIDRVQFALSGGSTFSGGLVNVYGYRRRGGYERKLWI
jgi:hypothetical protein